MAPEVADNLVDPLFKGICGGDIKNLSAATLVKNFYEYEANGGSIIRGALRKPKLDENAYKDLTEMRKYFKNQSVWRVRSGMSDLVNKIVDKLTKEENVKLLLNEPVVSLRFSKSDETSHKIEIKSKNSVNNVDLIVSSVYSKCKF